MADLTITTTTRSAVSNPVTFTAATATVGNKWVNTGREMIIIRNASGSPITATVVSPITRDGLAVQDRIYTVAAGATDIYGPFPKATYSDVDDSNKAKVVCSSVTSVTIAAIKN